MVKTRYISRVRKDREQEDSDFSDMSIIIPIAGMGRRMKTYGPKCMININGMSILERQIKQVRQIYPSSDIILVVGFGSSVIEERIRTKYKVRIVHNFDYENTNVAHSLYLGIQASSYEKCLIIYGDIIFNKIAIQDLYGGGSKIVIDNNDKTRREEVGVMHYGGEVTNLSYGIDEKWCQITYLSGKEMKMFESIAGVEDHRRWFGYEVLNEVINKGGKFLSCVPSGLRICEIDSPKDVKRVRSMGVISL
jgi:choline kinase